MGAVWRATHLDLGRAVALKFVLGDAPPDESIKRFLREARSAASVRHRNVVDVLDFGRDEAGAPYLVMECLEGESLEGRLKRDPRASTAEIVEWIAGSLSGLAAIHDAGIIHRDLKPGNIFLARDADGIVVKVLDFGIARTEEAAGATLTHSMQTLGTPHYMSPEQVRSAKIVDGRSDLYSMAVILYQCFSGRLPFEGPSATAIIAAIVTDEPLPIEQLCPDLAPALAGVVHRAMTRDISLRFPDARAMRRALLEAIGAAVTGNSSAQRVRPSGIATTMPMGPSPLRDAASRRSDPRSEELAAADTAAMSQLPEMSALSRRGQIQAPPDERPAKRSGRRGFFALFAAFSSVAVVGLAALAGGSMMLQSRDSAAIPTAVSPPVLPGGSVRGAGATTGIAPAARTVLTPALSLAEVSRRYRELAADARPCVLFAPADPDGERWAAITADTCGERSAALQTALLRPGESVASAEQITVHDGRAPQLLRTTVSSNYRTGPGVDNSLLGTFASRTLVVGIDDPAGAPAEEGRSPWIRVAAAEGYAGWMAARLAAPWEGCVPSSVDLGGPAALVSRVRVPVGSAMVDGLVIVHEDVLRVVTTDASCALEPLAETRLPGRAVDDWFVTSSGDEAGIGLLVVGTRARGVHGDGRVQWRAMRIDRALAVVWTVELFSAQTLAESRRDLIGGPFHRGPDRRDGYWPLRIRRGHGASAREFYVWNESQSTLVRDAGDDASEEPVPREDGPSETPPAME